MKIRSIIAEAPATGGEVASQAPLAVVGCPFCDKKFRIQAKSLGARMRCKGCEQIFTAESEFAEPSNINSPETKPAAPAKTRLTPNSEEFKPKADLFVKELQAVLLAKVRGTLAAAQERKGAGDVSQLKVNLVGIVTRILTTWRNIFNDPMLLSEERVANLSDYHARLLLLSIDLFRTFIDKHYPSGGKLHPAGMSAKQRAWVKQRAWNHIKELIDNKDLFSLTHEEPSVYQNTSAKDWLEDVLQRKPKLLAHLKKYSPELVKRMQASYANPHSDMDEATVLVKQAYKVLSNAVRTAK
jgi:hypothetical protein